VLEGITRIDNRLFQILTGRSRVGWPTIGWGIATSIFAYVALWFLPRRVVFSSVWVAFAVGCAATCPVAARLTRQAVCRSSYQFVRLTSVPAVEVVQGFVLVVLHRLRFALGWLLGIAPLFILSSYFYTFRGAKQHCFAYISRRNWAKVVHEFGFTRVYRLPEPAWCVAPNDVRLAGSALAYSPVPLALGCLLLMMIALGVAWGLAADHRSVWPRVGLAGTAIAAVLVTIYARLLRPAMQAPVFCQQQCTYVLPWPPDPPLETVLVVLFVLTTLGVVRLARRWV